MIKNLNEVKKIVGMGNINRQVVIIYREETKRGIGDLLIPLAQVKAGRTLSSRIDLIELEERVDMMTLLKRLENHPNVLVAEKNSTAKTMAEQERKNDDDCNMG